MWERVQKMKNNKINMEEGNETDKQKTHIQINENISQK